MKIEAHSVVKIVYQLRLKDGEVVEESNEENPFEVIIGINQTLPGFDLQLIGLGSGDSFNFELTPEEGFGFKDEGLVIKVPRENFAGAPEGSLELLKTLPMLDADGNTIFGVIVDLDDEFATMDFNHPLAGENLFFSGLIMHVRKAKPSEIEAGRAERYSSGEILDN